MSTTLAVDNTRPLPYIGRVIHRPVEKRDPLASSPFKGYVPLEKRYPRVTVTPKPKGYQPPGEKTPYVAGTRKGVSMAKQSRVRAAAEYMATPKTCSACGEEFRPREQEQVHAYKKRSTCSAACAKEAVRRARTLPLSDKACTVCGDSFTKREDERRDAFKRRMTCSEECRRISQRAAAGPLERLNPKTCEECGETFSKRENERPFLYERRTTCSRSCASLKGGKSRTTKQLTTAA